MFITIVILAILLTASLGVSGYLFYTQSKKPKATNKGQYTQEEFEAELEKRLSKSPDKDTDKLKEELKKANQQELQTLKLELRDRIQEEEKEMRARTLKLQESVDAKEKQLDTRLEKLDSERERIEKLKDELRDIRDDLMDKRSEIERRESEIEIEYTEKLESIAKLTKKDAAEKILQEATEDMGNQLINLQHKIVENAEEEANKKARQIVAMAIQRCSSEVANEFTITTVKLSSEEDKGKIIGKGGRNIQWLEKTLGVEFIIDETPEIVTISGFSSVRRNIAKRTLEMLLADGRLHPSSIEEMHDKAKAEIAQEVAEAGEWAVNELGIYDFPAKLVRLIGRLKFRTSYGQNMLKHSVEMAKLAGLLADELNAAFPNREEPIDKMICIKGALLHDIGKAIDEEMQPKGDHIELGEKVCDMFDLDWRIKKCISSHHDESYNDEDKGFCVEAVVVDACDGISGGRPGARKETAEAYFQRMEALERIASSSQGVTKSWIMRGSKEMWVFFDTDKVSPARMNATTRKIAKEIGNSVKSPVKIKVIGFYDKRIVEFAG
jgi:ribonuclease Y